MNTEEYRNFIESEYKKLYTDKSEKYMYVVMYGNEGCEGLKEIKEQKDLNCLMSMELRARINSQRDISIYAFSSEIEFDFDDITEKLLQNEKVIKVY